MKDQLKFNIINAIYFQSPSEIGLTFHMRSKSQPTLMQLLKLENAKKMKIISA